MNYLYRIIAAALITILAFGPAAAVTAETAFHEDDERVRIEDPEPTNNVEVEVNVKESNVRREITGEMTGVQFEAGSGDSSVFADATSTELSKDFLEFADKLYEIPLARWGGLTANLVGAFNSIGPMSMRTASNYIDTYPPKYNGQKSCVAIQFGLVEWIKLVTAVNPDVKLIICLSLEASTPEDNANLASFLLDEKDESQWGAMRAAYGIPDPVNLMAFELGNEEDLNSQVGNRFWVDQELLDWYCTQARANIDAIKAVHPEAKFMGCGKSTPHDNDPLGWDLWDTTIAEAIGEDMEYYAFHLYHGGYHLAYTEHWLDETTEHLKSVLGEDYPVKMYLTEQATWPNERQGTLYWDDAKVLSLQAQLDYGQFLNRMYMRNDVYGANYHNWTGNNRHWSWFNKYDDQWIYTGFNIVSDLYVSNLGDRIVDLDLESDSDLTNKDSTGSRLTAIATPKGDHEMTVFINNMSNTTTFDMNFNFENDYTLTEEIHFTAPSMTSYVSSPKTQDVFTTNVTEKNQAHFTSYHMPAKSLVVLKLTTTARLPQFGSAGGAAGAGGADDEAVYNGDAKYTDIEYCWAKNEISLLAEQGLLEGTDEGLFEPDRGVTRAEAAKMAAAVMELEAMDYSGLYGDVKADDWFAPWIQAMYAQGYMFGKGDGLFMPEDGITMDELAVLVSRIYSGMNPQSSVGGDLRLLESFTYRDRISDWARRSMAFCVEKGIFRRMYENGEMDPQKQVSRAEMAYVLYRLKNVNQ